MWCVTKQNLAQQSRCKCRLRHHRVQLTSGCHSSRARLLQQVEEKPSGLAEVAPFNGQATVKLLVDKAPDSHHYINVCLRIRRHRMVGLPFAIAQCVFATLGLGLGLGIKTAPPHPSPEIGHVGICERSAPKILSWVQTCQNMCILSSTARDSRPLCLCREGHKRADATQTLPYTLSRPLNSLSVKKASFCT